MCLNLPGTARLSDALWKQLDDVNLVEVALLGAAKVSAGQAIRDERDPEAFFATVTSQIRTFFSNGFRVSQGLPDWGGEGADTCACGCIAGPCQHVPSTIPWRSHALVYLR